MVPKPRNLGFEQVVDAPIKEVYRAFTNSTLMREWLCDAAQVNPHPEGRLYLWWNSGYYMCGEFMTVEANKTIGFTWHGRGDPGDTEVLITLSEKGNGTSITLKHSKVKARGTWIKYREGLQYIWGAGLENLASVLETGQDLRLVRRPMLGISIGDFNAEKAAQLGVPVSEGVRLDGVIDGLGAQAAGLQKDDVLVSVAGTPVTGFPELAKALQGWQAGDKVEVIFYRGDQRNVVVMELSHRPIPVVPMVASELAEAVSKSYTESDGELTRCFEGVSEIEASHRPAASEWSAKQVIAHLIHSERGLHEWITDLVNCQERVAEGYSDNVQARIDATLTAYPTVEGLLTELHRNQAETVAFLENLPQEFVARKSGYWRLGCVVLDGTSHTRNHLDQIRAAIQSARGS